MRKLLVFVGAVFLFSMTAAWAAEPIGSYDIKGTNPGGGGGGYTGTVTVEKTGQTYKIVWTIGGKQYFGTGIGNKDFLAVSYLSGSHGACALRAGRRRVDRRVDLCRRHHHGHRPLDADGERARKIKLDRSAIAIRATS